MRVALGLILLGACSSTSPVQLTRSPPPTIVTSAPPPPTTATTLSHGPVLIRYRIEVHTADAATAEFASVVDATLRDPRGWRRAGFILQRTEDAPYTILLAEGAEVQQRCRPYDTYGRYSCQLGPLVAITADRWRAATPEWTGDLATYRQELVNHEVGHLLGLHHRKCPAQGQPAPVMAQQSTNLDGCRPNPWPLPVEIERAARHDLRLAPPYERDTVDQ